MDKLLTKIKKILLVGGDILILYLSLWIALNIRYNFVLNPNIWQQHFLPFTIIYFLWLIIFYISGLYDLTLARNNQLFYSTLFKVLIIAAILSITFFYLMPYFGIAPKTNLFLNLAVFAVIFPFWRQLFNYFIKSSAFMHNILIIGKTNEAKELYEYIKENPQLGYYPKKILDYQEVHLIFDLVENIVKENIQTIVTAINPHKDSALIRNLYQCLPLKISLIDLPSFYERIIGKIPVSAIEEIWFLENLMNNDKKLYESIKRILDILGSLIFGIITLPLYPIIALLIKIDSPGPVFYKQKRVGQDGKIFTLVKFRSMIQDAEKYGAQWTTENDSRVTRVGNFLRKTRLDELPQLWNVLKGEMSFVGPRPERPEIAFGKDLNLQKQIPFYQIRHLIKPGLTGWAQINFRYGASVEDSLEKLQYDIYYLKNYSFTLDLAIVLKTIKTILSRAGR